MWVEKYLINQLQGFNKQLSEKDLWYARCSLLHNGTSESSHVSSKKYFYSDYDFKFPDTKDFIDSISINVLSFYETIFQAIYDCIMNNDENDIDDFLRRTLQVLSKSI